MVGSVLGEQPTADVFCMLESTSVDEKVAPSGPDLFVHVHQTEGSESQPERMLGRLDMSCWVVRVF